jgi:hypothetical protein
MPSVVGVDDNVPRIGYGVKGSAGVNSPIRSAGVVGEGGTSDYGVVGKSNNNIGV